MLRHLSITNIVLIDHLMIDWGRGVTALTGETGAGKSILLDSIQLALGARADAGLIRHGCETATVTAVFDPVGPEHPAHVYLEEQGIISKDDLILRRNITRDGRSKAFVNDQPVSVATLRALGAELIDIHGQFETHALLDPAAHREGLDRFAGTLVLRAQVGHAYRKWQNAIADHAKARNDLEQAIRDEEFLTQALADLEQIKPERGEIAQLSEQKQSAQHRASVLDALTQAREAVSGHDGAEDRLREAARTLDRMAGRADMLRAITELIDPVLEGVNAINAAIETLADRFSDGLTDPEAIDDRLHTLKSQARKLNCLPDDLPDQIDRIRETLAGIRTAHRTLDGLDEAVIQAESHYHQLADDLSARRKTAAKALDHAINAELPALKLGKARFETDCAQGDAGPMGSDCILFRVATNPGTDPGPLHKIASGGEMARLMLALKLAMAAHEQPRTLIFDEVDQGIGGSTADAVGERLHRLGHCHQVLVITHSPQVAARADAHGVVSKDSTTRVELLTDPTARREEIARMLAGSSITDEARAAADRLLHKAA